MGRFLPSARAAALPLAILLLVLVMVVPIPKQLLDLFFVANIAISLAVLMVALNARKPLDFSAFPTVLLFATLFRLGLNVASTRVVLVHGHEGEAAGGTCHRGVRDVPDRRRLRRRHLRLRDPAHHQPDRRHQGRGPRLRGLRAVHPRRLAGQADGDRRGSERRADDAGRSQGAPRRGRDRSRFLRRDGRLVEVREGRRHRRAADPRGERRRRADPGAVQPRHGVRRPPRAPISCSRSATRWWRSCPA